MYMAGNLVHHQTIAFFENPLSLYMKIFIVCNAAKIVSYIIILKTVSNFMFYLENIFLNIKIIKKKYIYYDFFIHFRINFNQVNFESFISIKFEIITKNFSYNKFNCFYFHIKNEVYSLLIQKLFND